jgi:hypothetical protein
MARVPTPMRLSKLLASLQLKSTVEPTPGAGDVLPRITATIVAFFLIAFKECSIRDAVLFDLLLTSIKGTKDEGLRGRYTGKERWCDA